MRAPTPGPISTTSICVIETESWGESGATIGPVWVSWIDELRWRTGDFGVGESDSGERAVKFGEMFEDEYWV